jgi:adenosylhomocysteine nucleosidase
LVEGGVAGLVSFGLAGGLDPALTPGMLLVPAVVLLDAERWDADSTLMRRLGGSTPGALHGGGEVVASAAAKATLHARTGAVAVDLESAAVARTARRHGLPFAVLRAVCDGAGRDLPRAALVALDGAGRIGGLRVAWAAASRPWEISGLIRLGGDAARARHALVARVRAIGRL